MIVNPLVAAGLVGLSLASAALVLRLSPAARRLLAPEAPRERAIDGLRGYLALCVFVHHGAITWFFLKGGVWKLPPSRLFGQLGQVGVALFFMVTAFLFWGRVLERRGRLDWAAFLQARFWRLTPAWLATLAGVLAAVVAEAGFTWRQPAAEALRGLGTWLLFTYPAPADLNGFAGTGRLVAYAAWSLPYEVLFYAVLPLAAMLRFRALRPRAALACLLLLGAMLLLAGGRPPFRLPVLASFAGGVVAAHAARSAAVRRWCRGSLAGLLALACLAAALTGFRTAFTPAVTLLLTGFFTVVACGNSLRGALDRPAALWLGQASYSLYLQHGLVLWLVADRLGGLLDPGRDSEAVFVALLALCCPVLVGLASLSALLVEQPGIALGHRARGRRPGGRAPLAAPRGAFHTGGMIYVDGDACPVREEVFRVAARLDLPVRVVSNGSRPVRPPGLPNVEMVLVPEGADAADDWIAERIARGDVCVTADIPLASRCLAKGARALGFKGRSWTPDNIGNALAGRAVSAEMRERGLPTGGPAPLTAADRSRFLSALDAEIAAARRDAAAPPPRPWVSFE